MSMTPDTDVLEPEVIPPVDTEPKEAENTGPEGTNPIYAGLLIDILKLLVFGPLGFLVGGFIGFSVARSSRLQMPVAVLIGIATGWYCWLPLPYTMPVATLVGIIIVLSRKWGR